MKFNVVLYVRIPIDGKIHSFSIRTRLPFAPFVGLRLSNVADENDSMHWWVDVKKVEWNIEYREFWCDIMTKDYFDFDSIEEARDWWIADKGWEYDDCDPGAAAKEPNNIQIDGDMIQ